MTTQLQWERRTDKTGLIPRWSGFLLLVVGLALFVLLTVVGLYAGALVGLCIAGFAVPVFLLPRRSLTVRDNAIVCKQQLPWRNGLVWWTFMFAGVSLGMLIDVADGDAALRPRIIGVLSIAVTVILAAVSIQKTRRLLITPSFVELASQRIELPGATIDVIMNGQAPMIRVRQRPNADGSLGPRVLIPPYPYGLDPNTLASAIAQLVQWVDEGHDTTPETISSMLSVAAPANVPVGGAVDIPLAGEGRTETPPTAR